MLVESIGLWRGEGEMVREWGDERVGDKVRGGDGEGVRGGGCTHSTKVPKVSHFPPESSLVRDGHSILPLRTSCRPIHRLPGVCTSRGNIM